MHELFDGIRTLTHEPVTIGQTNELYGRNWQLFSDYVNWSRGKALILMHPAYPYEKDYLQWVSKNSEESELFNHVCLQTVQTMRKAVAHMPVLLYVSVSDPDQSTRTAASARSAIQQTLEILSEYGLDRSQSIFFVPTNRSSPKTFEPLTQHVKQLESAGLSYAILGGMYFRLDRNPMYEDTFHPIGPHNHSKISEMIQRDHQLRVNRPNNPHPLTLVAPDTSSSCLGEYADYLAHYTTIRFRFGRGLTYPDPIPRPGELQRTQYGYEFIQSSS